MRLTNLDAAESIFFVQQLAQLKQRTYDRLFPELKARMFIPTDEAIASGAESFLWEEFDEVGLAKIIANYADDLPMADISGQQFTGKIRSLGMSYGWSLQDVRAAALAGKPLSDRKATSARRGIDTLIDTLLAVGDADNDLPGFLNATNVPVLNVANGAGGNSEWTTKTPAEILIDINLIVSDTVDATNGVEVGPFDLIFPLEQYTILAQTKNSDSSDVTILEFILSSNPFIRSIDNWHRLKEAGGASADRGVLYTRAPEKLEAIIPQEFEQMELETRNLSFQVPTHARCGGTVVHYPLSMRYMDDI